MNKIKKFVMYIMVALMYFTLILAPVAMILDTLLEIETRLEEGKSI